MSYTLYKNITVINRTVINNKQNKYIVIHYTGNTTDTAKANSEYFKSVNRSASAHYFVDETSVYQVVEEKDAAWSVGKNYGKNNLFHTVKNSNSINIEMCSTQGKISDATFQNTIELTRSLMKKYNIPAANVYRHYDVCSKQCPGWIGWIGGNTSLWNKFKENISAVDVPSTVSQADVPTSAHTDGTFKVKVIVDALNIRKGAGIGSQINGCIRDKGTYTITETCGSWGKLKSGAGWINISSSYVKRI